MKTHKSLTFKEGMPLGLEVVLKLENLDSHEEKEISFKTTNGKVQNVLLTSSNLTSGKWKIKSFSFDKTYSHSPTIETTFDFKTNEKLKQERIEKIQKAIDKYQIKIKQNYKDKPLISKYALSNFDLNLNFKDLEIVNNSLKFDGSNLNQDLKSEKQMKITFEKVSENQANKTRKAHFKITTLDNLVFEKTLEWSYKTNKEYLDEFKNGSALWDDLQASLTSVFEKSLWHPYQLPKAKSKINTINLINDVSASFQGYDYLDDFNGSAKLKFKLQRGQEQRDITFTINGFLKVSLIDPLYKGNLRNSEFDVKASSNGYWLGQYYTAAEVFKHYSNGKSYWYATANDGNPWLEFSWKDNTLADIYGFELLFWNNKDYYKKDSYKVEYKSNGNSEWKALENVEITSMPFEKDKRFIQEIVKIKKERISAVRIVFLKDKKPTYPSVFSLNPIVRTVF
ncbi:lipoprotein 17-related variable surface protein [Mycoplasmopsis pulmonis]|uniref:lipoprotein 17-related variable surface protein n=1 Tax=Mycoplasmopsis pulmonis TaxID=2107 RepID=UPI002ACECB64|nr:lipoprotein 17-related variable surface protein [Mycoplasmopsis pulmonis]MDZ7293666.1 lipoprotein 17-related variable surface protein [Mycoplasmopsis pulmonis]